MSVLQTSLCAPLDCGCRHWYSSHCTLQTKSGLATRGVCLQTSGHTFGNKQWRWHQRRAAGIHDENILGQGCLYCTLAFAPPSTAAADKLSIHQDLGSRCSRPGLVFLPLHSAGQIKSLRLGVHSAGQIKPLRLGVSVLQTSLCAPPCTHMSTCLFKQPTPGTSSETVVAVAKKKKRKKSCWHP